MALFGPACPLVGIQGWFPGPAEPEDSARDVRAKSSSGSTGPQTLRRSREFSLRRIFKDTEP
ncbi:uncharacterized protein LOC144136367 isoform X2 [Amblyomma americanum]